LTAPAAATAITSQLQSATDAVDSATTGARAALDSPSGFPTPGTVAAVVNPYIASLQLYEAFMSGAAVPEAARPAADTAEGQVRQDVSFLQTVNGLPSIHLGTFLQQFSTDTTQLQSSLTTLEQDLRTPAKG
jgi:hypothetical protein